MIAPAGADPIPLQIGIIPTIANAGYYAADKFGYFAAENVAITAQVIRGGAAAIPALTNGSIDVLFSNATSVVEAITRGIDLRLVIEGTIMANKPPDSGALVKRRGDPIHTGKDLEGKVIATNALRDVIWMVVTAWISATGGDPQKVGIIEVPIPAMVDAVKQKRVDAALIIDPVLTSALDDPALELLDWPLSRVYAGGPTSMWVTTPDVTQRRASDLRAFLRAYRRGALWVNANLGKDAYYDLVVAFSGLNADVVRRMKPVPTPPDIVPNSLLRLTALMHQTGLLTTNVDLRTKIFT